MTSFTTYKVSNCCWNQPVRRLLIVLEYWVWLEPILYYSPHDMSSTDVVLLTSWVVPVMWVTTYTLNNSILVVVGWFRRVLTPCTHQYSLYFTKNYIQYTISILNNIDNIQYYTIYSKKTSPDPKIFASSGRGGGRRRLPTWSCATRPRT